MTVKELMRPWKAAGPGFIWRRTIFKPFRDKRARACVVGEKRGGGGWKESVKGRLIFMSPSASSILSPQSPSFFPSTPHRAACSLRKHPFLLAPRRWGRFARRNDGCFRRLRCMPRRPKKVQHSKQQLEPLCCGPWSPIRKEHFQYVEVSSEVERGVVGWEGGGNKGNGFCRWSTPCKLPKNS